MDTRESACVCVCMFVFVCENVNTFTHIHTAGDDDMCGSKLPISYGCKRFVRTVHTMRNAGRWAVAFQRAQECKRRQFHVVGAICAGGTVTHAGST
jgi:hypothetical protein